MLANIFFAVGWHQHAHAISEFKHQIRRRYEVGVVTPDVQQMSGKTRGHRKSGEWYAHDVGFADKHANVVKITTILGQAARRELSKLRGGFGNRFLLLGDDQEGISR